MLFLLAAGLSVIFGLMDVLNLAHGSFYMLGAFIGLSVIRVTGNFWLALLVAPVVVAFLGGLMEVALFRRTYKSGHLSQVLLTIGCALILVDLVRWYYGSTIQSIAPPGILAGSVSFAGIRYPSYRFMTIVLAALLAGGMMLGWRRLKVGAVLRAAVTDAQMVELLGIDVARVFTLTFAGGAGLAAFAGVVAGPYLSVFPGMDDSVLILALVVVVVGGLGSIEGAALGALGLGLANSFGTYYLQDFAVAIVFAVMAGVLLIRPRGLFGAAP